MNRVYSNYPIGGISFNNAGQYIYSSDDTGSTWTQINTLDLGMQVVYCIESSNDSYGGVYIGTGGGVYYIDSTLSNWQPMLNGFPNVVVKDIEILPGFNKIRVATYGRGVWENSLFDHNQPPVAGVISDKDTICTGEIVQFFDNSLNNGPGYNAQYNWQFPGGTPSVSTDPNPIVIYNAQGDYDVTLSITNNNGNDSITSISHVHVVPITTTNIPLAEGFQNTLFPPPGWEIQFNTQTYSNWLHGILDIPHKQTPLLRGKLTPLNQVCFSC